LLPNNTASETFLQKSGVVQVLTGDLPKLSLLLFQIHVSKFRNH
jgi:hypothetical protein